MAGRRASISIREGVVSRIVPEPTLAAQQESFEEELGNTKGLTPDWGHVLSTRKNRAVSTQFGFPVSTPNLVPCETTAEKPAEHFVDGSKYSGQWNNIGMNGFGTYRMPHDVEFEGEIRDGKFHGDGTLIYPSGSKMFGVWREGRMMKRKYQFADGLQFSEHKWKYCTMPDRRYFAEYDDAGGIRPAGRSLKTQEIPTRKIPPGCFDTGDGFYNPVLKCVKCPKTGRILRIPNNEEDAWIKEHCRRAEDVNTGLRPDIYENWFDPNFTVESDHTMSESEENVPLQRIATTDTLKEEFESEMSMDDSLSLSYFFHHPATSSALLLLERVAMAKAVAPRGPAAGEDASA